ncbi:unnamed protein product [Polarella glacialis]|uniref:Uncharacterized protein n=1 Tax=Polarella glacialis TaxID=89957 RepID=A0A813H308_POLGL|nr:unnamed protein product [Polarella glacialis]
MSHVGGAICQGALSSEPLLSRGSTRTTRWKDGRPRKLLAAPWAVAAAVAATWSFCLVLPRLPGQTLRSFTSVSQSRTQGRRISSAASADAEVGVSKASFDPLAESKESKPLAESKESKPLAESKESKPLAESKESKGFAVPGSGRARKDILRVQAVGSSRGSFLMEMGGVRILVNPNLEGSDMEPENVHELVDYVFITGAEEEYFHQPTIERMNLQKVKFVAGAKAGEALEPLMVKYLDVLQPGPDGRCLLSGPVKGSSVAILAAPGGGGSMPWDKQEEAFVFVNLETGIAVGYAGSGQYLGPGAATFKRGIPEEAYQVDYLVGPSFREAAFCAEGLTKKGAVLRGIVILPSGLESSRIDLGGSKMPDAYNTALDSLLGGIDDSQEAFQTFMEKQGAPLSKTRLLLPVVGGEAVNLEI